MKNLLLILILVGAFGCVSSEQGFMVVNRVEKVKYPSVAGYKYLITFEGSNTLLTNELYQVGDTLK